jgi:hypothetical protein
MAYVLEDECDRAGLDPKRVSSIARRLSSAAKDAKALGLTIFGGSGSGSLRWRGPDTNDYRTGPLVVAHLDGSNFDGGDGAEHSDEFGLMRGEDG